MSWESLKLVKNNGIAVLSLNEPEILNALTMKMESELKEIIADLKADRATRVLLLTGEGSSFCSGGDLDSAFAMYNEPPAQGKEHVVSFYKTFLALRDLDIPTIAVIKGHTLGAGLCLALACDLRIASSDSKMSMSFVKIGLHPGMGGTYLLPKLVGPAKALELFYTGDLIDPKEAQRIGLVNHVVEPEQLMDFAYKLAGRIARNAPIPVRLVKKAVYQSLECDFDTALGYESFAQMMCAVTEDLKEGIAAVRAKRAPAFKDR